MNIVLFTSGVTAVESFNEIVNSGFLKGVVIPDMYDEGSAIIYEIVRAKNIPHILLKDKKQLKGEILEWVKEINPDVIFVMTFTNIIPKEILEIPKWGCYNWHSGILPEYRGPDPVFWEFVNGEKEGGVTLHKMDATLDTGPIVKIEKMSIEEGQTHGEFYRKLSVPTLELTRFMLYQLSVDPENVESCLQDQSKAKYYKLPSEVDLMIHWDKDSDIKIKRCVQACNPVYGGARTLLRGQTLCVMQVSIFPKDKCSESFVPGEVVSTDEEKGLIVACKDNSFLKIEIINCLEGIYTGTQFIKNFKVKKGERFVSFR